MRPFTHATHPRHGNAPHGRPFQIQKYHAPQGCAGQEAVQPVLEAQPRDYRGGEDGHARSGHEPGENFEEIRYEGYGPGGSAIIVEALTDNRNRTATAVRTAFSKNGGNLGTEGSVVHGFERLGLIVYPADAGSEDKVLEAAMEAGADDIVSSEDGHEIWTAADDLHQVASDLEKSLGEAETVKLAWKPNLTVDMDEKDAGTLLKLIDTLDDDDDVQTVWGNYDISDEVMEKVG